MKHSVLIPAIMTALVMMFSAAFAQTPNPVTPGYQICTNASGSTQCGFQPTDTTHGLPVQSLGGAFIAASQATVTTTASIIMPARAGRMAATITNQGTTDVFCGPSTVTAANGDLIAGVKGTSKTYSTSAAIYCIVGTGTQAVSVAETY